jgi:hypothetical protein
MRAIGLTTTLETSSQSVPRDGAGGSVLLSQGFYTECDSIATGDSMYTQGIAGNFDYLSDTIKFDTTALALDAFVGQRIPVSFFFLGTTDDTLFITYEAAYSFYPPACDTARAHSGTTYFNSGFWTVDTLFSDSLNATKDTMIVKNTGSAPSGAMQRWYRDTLNVVAPCIRIKIVNKGHVIMTNPIHTEMYCRQSDAVITGAAGRLQDRWHK